jgi:putative copper export protein
VRSPSLVTVDEVLRLVHLVAAGVWLGGMTMLAVVAVVAARTLDREAFRLLMGRAGRAFAALSVVAWLALAVSGAAMAWPRLHHSLAELTSTAFGTTLALKTGLAVGVVLLTVAHSLAGRRPGSRASIVASRALSPLILLGTVAIFWLAVRLTEG